MHKKKNQYFGLESFITSNKVSEFSALTNSMTQIAYLNSDIFNTLIMQYPLDFEKFRMIQDEMQVYK